MKDSEFEKLFNSILGYNKFKVKITQPPEFNITQFQKMAFLQHNCKFLYENLSNLYGEEYGEKIITDVIKGKFTISNPENFTYKDKLHLKESLYIAEGFTNKYYNALSSIGTASFLINNACRYVNEVLCPDALMVLSIYVCKILNANYYSGASFKSKRERYIHIQMILRTFINTICVKRGEENKITLCILDKKTFNYIKANRDCSVHYLGIDRVIILQPHYEEYKKFLKLFIKTLSGLKGLQLPKLVYYIYPTKEIKDLVIGKIFELTGIIPTYISSTLKDLYIDEGIDFDLPEYNSILEDFIKRAKKPITKEELKNTIIQVIDEGVSDSADRITVDKLPLYKLMKKSRQQARPQLMWYNKKNYKDVFKPKISEVSLDFNMIKDDLLTIDELMKKLIEAYVDAQAINQARLSIVKTNKYTDCRCNVIVKNVDDTLIPTVFNELEQQTKFLKSTYGVDFTFEIETNLD